MDIPAIFKVLTVFAAVLFANRLRVPLGIALACGGFFLDFWAVKNIPHVFVDGIDALCRPELWLLLLDISLITVLGQFLSSTRVSSTLLGAARQLGGKHGTAISLILIPATIGMVPMPGGALFSAPLVGSGVKGHSFQPQWKAAVNYWFRHVLEYWWPLYPVVIVTLSIFPITTWQFVGVQIPFTLLSVVAGYYFLLRPHTGILAKQENNAPPPMTKDIFSALLPVCLVLAATLLLPKVLVYLLPHTTPATRRLTAMLCGLVVALGLPSVRQNCGANSVVQTIFSAKTGKMLATLAGVMIFHFLLERSGLMVLAAGEAAAYQSAIFLIAALLPFIAGFVTGIAIGFAGIAFPLVIGLITSTPSSLGIFSGLSLAFSMGYCGMMLSPVHLCLVLTREYFKSSYFGAIRLLIPPVAVIMSGGILMHIFFLQIGL